MKTRVLIIIGIAAASLVVAGLIFTGNTAHLAPYSYVSMQQTCGNFYQPEFVSISTQKVQQNPILLGLSEGITGDLLPTPVQDTKNLLAIVGHPLSMADSFGVNINEKSYLVQYLFSFEPIHATDHVIGCFDNGLVNSFQNEPVVAAFHDMYNAIYSFGRDDKVVFSSSIKDSFSARLSLYFDENFEIEKMSYRCNNDEAEVYYEITKEDEILYNLQSMHCLYDKYPHVKISINEYKTSYKKGDSTENFTVKLEGYYSTYNAPDITLRDESGNTLWSNYEDIGHVYSSRTHPIDLCKEYKFNDIGGPLILNDTGTYSLVFSFEEFSFERTFYVREDIGGNIANSTGFSCSKDLENENVFHGKQLSYWKNLDEDSLVQYYENLGNHEENFFDDLGVFLIKSYSEEKLLELGITPASEIEIDWKGIRPSLPPRMGFDAKVNSTDGKSYLITGTIHGNEILDNFQIAEDSGRRIGWTPAFEYSRVQINGTTALQICSIMEIDCTKNPVWDAIHHHDEDFTYFYYDTYGVEPDVQIGEHYIQIDKDQICHSFEDLLSQQISELECQEIKK